MGIYLMMIFFFQAEDGIRDIGVTGVQTCALPISPTSTAPSSPDARAPDPRTQQGSDALMMRGMYSAISGLKTHQIALDVRSEERRVGKECRSRWSPYH